MLALSGGNDLYAQNLYETFLQKSPIFAGFFLNKSHKTQTHKLKIYLIATHKTHKATHETQIHKT